MLVYYINTHDYNIPHFSFELLSIESRQVMTRCHQKNIGDRQSIKINH